MNDFVGYRGPLDFVGQAATFANPQAVNRTALASLAAQFQNPQNMVSPEALGMVAAMAAKQALAGQQPQGLPAGVEMLQGTGRGIVRDQLLALGTRQTLAAAASATIVAQPQRPFRIKRLIIETSSGNPADFVVSRFDVGVEPQIIGAGELPGSLFSAQGFQVDLKTDTANVGNTITIVVTNISAGPITLTLGAVGLSLT